MAIFWKIGLVVTLALCSQVFAQVKKSMLGGWRDADENEELAQTALKFAKEEYNKNAQNSYITDISKIIRLRKQIVSGVKYSMEVEAAISPCSENAYITEECQNEKITRQRCTFDVYLKPWENIKQLNRGYCNAIAGK